MKLSEVLNPAMPIKRLSFTQSGDVIVKSLERRQDELLDDDNEQLHKLMDVNDELSAIEYVLDHCHQHNGVISRTEFDDALKQFSQENHLMFA